jgi:conjugal transfer pilus assembly protein TraD
MANKEKSSDLGLGEFIVPIIDLMSILIMKGTEFLGIGISWAFNRYVFKKKTKNEIKKVERKETENMKSTKKEDALGYSVSKKKDLLFCDIEKKKHSMIVGASGFGKTVLLDTLMYDDMKKGKPVIYLDPKGDAKSLAQFINLCRLSGREYRVFSESYQGEGKLNLDLTKDGTATHIADRIHYSFDWSEEHYETLCYRALKVSITNLKQTDGVVNFESILAKVKELADSKNAQQEFARKDVEGLIARLENIVQSDFGENLSGNGLSLCEVWDEGKCVYIGMPVLGYPKIARALGKIILGDLSYAVYKKYSNLTIESEKRLTPIGVYIDELSAVITDEFIELLNKCRGVKMELTFAFQTPSDINKVSPDLCEQILENSSNWFILKQRMEKGANLFSEAIGTLEGKKDTVRIKDGEEQAQGSQRAVEELVVHANLIKNLNPGQCILLRHGPTQIDLVNIKYINPELVYKNVNFLENIGEISKVNSSKVISKEACHEIEDGGAL